MHLLWMLAMGHLFLPLVSAVLPTFAGQKEIGSENTGIFTRRALKSVTGEKTHLPVQHNSRNQLSLGVDVQEIAQRGPTKRKRRMATTDQSLKWIDGVVHYRFSDDFSDVGKEAVLSGMKVYEQYTCLSFWEATPYTRDVINIVRGKGAGGEQQLMLGESCYISRIVLHELGHAIGWFHPPEDGSVEPLGDLSSDNNSIMFPVTVTVARADHLSFGDIRLANLMYDCAKGCPRLDCRDLYEQSSFMDKTCQCLCPGNETEPIRHCKYAITEADDTEHNSALKPTHVAAVAVVVAAVVVLAAVVSFIYIRKSHFLLRQWQQAPYAGLQQGAGLELQQRHQAVDEEGSNVYAEISDASHECGAAATAVRQNTNQEEYSQPYVVSSFKKPTRPQLPGDEIKSRGTPSPDSHDKPIDYLHPVAPPNASHRQSTNSSNDQSSTDISDQPNSSSALSSSSEACVPDQPKDYLHPTALPPSASHNQLANSSNPLPSTSPASVPDQPKGCLHPAAPPSHSQSDHSVGHCTPDFQPEQKAEGASRTSSSTACPKGARQSSGFGEYIEHCLVVRWENE
ncbi:hypothetical protein BaRGS_00008936 [Batillaria attramentaria]|uniref:Metalloendopeptidase n=1 Tax=Batillaria attramentaria TaxID=370345 RepID=A0ABD0LKA5_9CAEN